MKDKQGYILDTNALIPLVNPANAKRQIVIDRLRAASPDSPVSVAASTLAELEVGCCLGDRDRDKAQAEIREAIRLNGFRVLEFTRHTAAQYGMLKAALMLKYNRMGAKRNRAKWPENWPRPDTGAALGIDEFDLLVVSHALEQRLVLVTDDEMNRIREGLGEAAGDLDVEDWSVSATTSE